MTNDEWVAPMSTEWRTTAVGAQHVAPATANGAPTTERRRHLPGAADYDALPLRLFLGSDTLRNVGAGLHSRLAELQSQADRAPLTDADPD